MLYKCYKMCDRVSIIEDKDSTVDVKSRLFSDSKNLNKKHQSWLQKMGFFNEISDVVIAS